MHINKNPTTYKRCHQGFTLLEVLLAMAIFSMVSVAAYTLLANLMKAEEITAYHSDSMADLEKVFIVMERDFEQVVQRPVRDGFGDVQPALEALTAGQVSFTRNGWSNPAWAYDRSQLQRVQYQYDNEVLLRRSWAHLDNVVDSQPVEVELLEGVSDFSFRYLGSNPSGDGMEWFDAWPTEPFDGDPHAQPLPFAIEVKMTVEGWGELTRFFRVPANEHTL